MYKMLKILWTFIEGVWRSEWTQFVWFVAIVLLGISRFIALHGIDTSVADERIAFLMISAIAMGGIVYTYKEFHPSEGHKKTELLDKKLEMEVKMKNLKTMSGIIQIKHGEKMYEVVKYEWSNIPGSETIWDIAMKRIYDDVQIILYELSNKGEEPEFTFQLIDDCGDVVFYKVDQDQIEYIDGMMVVAREIDMMIMVMK